MAATRLSDSQKTELVSGFQAGESTQALADRFGCSANTVTRIARTALGGEAYEQLKRQRLRGAPQAAQLEVLELTVTVNTPTVNTPLAVVPAPAVTADPAETLPSVKGDRAASERGAAAECEAEAALDAPGAPRGGQVDDGLEVVRDSDPDGIPLRDDNGEEAAIDVDLGVVAEIDADVDIDDDSEYGDDDDDLLIGEDDDEAVDADVDAELNVDDDQAGFLPIAVLGFGGDELGAPAELRPLASAQLPASVYMLVDKTVELQARPLSEIAELGQLPPDEQDRQALVVFTNPRQAKRLCGRTQRVIKLPDTRVIERTAPYLLNQGISRVVIEGALYALPGS